MKLLVFVAKTLFAGIALALPCACERPLVGGGPDRPPGLPDDVLVQTVCAKSPCSGIRFGIPFQTKTYEVDLHDCRGPSCSLVGTWWPNPAARSAYRQFDWAATLRNAAIFPEPGHLFMCLDCPNDWTWRYSSNTPPSPLLAIDPPGVGLALMRPGDVFIPYEGRATIDRLYDAFFRPEDAVGGSSRVTIWVEEPVHPRAVYPSLAVGNTFAWGPRVGTVVRIVPAGPRERNAKVPMGWVEIAMSDSPPSDEASP
jgi:hypothetical protein